MKLQPAHLLLCILPACALSSCRMVGTTPDFAGVGELFRPAQNDIVYVESKPAGYKEPPETTPLAFKLTPPATGAPVAAAAGGVYIVQSGDTLSRIARTHRTHVRALAAANGLDQKASIIKPGQKLRIPQGGAAAPAPAVAKIPSKPAPAAKPTPAENIAAAPQPVAAPRAAEPPTPAIAAAPVAAPAPKVPAAAGRHIVRPGETLAAVSRRYNVNLQELLRINKLTNETARFVRPGTTLTLPTQRK